MATQRRSGQFDEEPPATRTTVTAHVPSPGRTVFTESGNTDGWIATDATVDLDRYR